MAQIRDPAHAGDKVEIQMRGVDLRLELDVVLEIRSLRGQLERTDASKPVTFDDGNSFVLDVQSGEIAIGAQSFSQLLNSYVFAYSGSPLKGIVVTFKR